MHSCSGSECKELLARLGWGEVAEALDDPVPVVAVAKLRERLRQVLEVPERARPQQLPLERVDESLDEERSFVAPQTGSSG